MSKKSLLKELDELRQLNARYQLCLEYYANPGQPGELWEMMGLWKKARVALGLPLPEHLIVHWDEAEKDKAGNAVAKSKTAAAMEVPNVEAPTDTIIAGFSTSENSSMLVMDEVSPLTLNDLTTLPAPATLDDSGTEKY